jgi:sec-independent protein translocase protein TatC
MKDTKEKHMTVQEHFLELRKRIFISLFFFVIFFFVSYFFSEKIYQFLLAPFAKISLVNQDHQLIYTSPTEAFTTYLKLSFYSALFFSFPIFFLQLYLFLSPALYKNEKKNILKIFFFITFLFLFGAIFAYYFILPLALKFFASFGNQGFADLENFSLQLQIKISEYLSFVLNLIFGFGIAFISPILLLFFLKVGLLSIDDLRKKRRYWIVIIFIMAAILTPPDVLSQLSLATLMIMLFEIVILIGKNINNKK